MPIFVINSERCIYGSPKTSLVPCKINYPTFRLHTACLAATHRATVSTDGIAAKIPHQEGGEYSGDGGAISICRQVSLEPHRCNERTGNHDTPLSAIARLQRDCKVSRKRERSKRRAKKSPGIREVVSNRMRN